MSVQLHMKTIKSSKVNCVEVNKISQYLQRENKLLLVIATIKIAYFWSNMKNIAALALSSTWDANTACVNIRARGFRSKGRHEQGGLGCCTPVII